jgi:hypothetical protein
VCGIQGYDTLFWYKDTNVSEEPAASILRVGSRVVQKVDTYNQITQRHIHEILINLRSPFKVRD